MHVLEQDDELGLHAGTCQERGDPLRELRKQGVAEGDRVGTECICGSSGAFNLKRLVRVQALKNTVHKNIESEIIKSKLSSKGIQIKDH